jgi:hypothetical protein
MRNEIDKPADNSVLSKIPAGNCGKSICSQFLRAHPVIIQAHKK